MCNCGTFWAFVGILRAEFLFLNHVCLVTFFQVFLSALQAGCNKNSSFPKDFTSNILASVDNEIFNKLR